MAINDDDDFGGRDNQVMWASTNTDLFMRSDHFPSVSLVDELYVAGPGTIGTMTEDTSQQNPVYGPRTDESPGLLQEWYAAANPGNKEGVDAVFESQDPMVPPFRRAWPRGGRVIIRKLAMSCNIPTKFNLR